MVTTVAPVEVFNRSQAREKFLTQANDTAIYLASVETQAFVTFMRSYRLSCALKDFKQSSAIGIMSPRQKRMFVRK